jgi:hypothetical protein
VILSLLAAAIVVQGAAPQQPSSREALRHYLKETIGYSDGDWRDILQGKAVAKNLDTPEAVDVSIFGAVRVRGRSKDLADQIRDIDVFERKLNVIGVGKFSDPPRLGDLDGLELTAQDVQDLKNCRPGHCELQLSAKAMARFDAAVDWEDGNASAQANRIYREMMFDALRDYRVGGVDTLGTYDDRKPPTPISEEVHGLANPLDTPMPIPDLTRFLRDYPRGQLDGAESLFYWNMGEFGMKPTTRLNQIVIQPFADAGRRRRRRRRGVLPALRHALPRDGSVGLLQGPASSHRQASRALRHGAVPHEHAGGCRRPARGTLGA